MTPLPFVWPYAAVFWVVFAWAFAIESRFMRRAVPDARAQRTHDAGSMWMVVAGNYFATLLAFAIAFLVPRASITAGRVAVFWIGIATLIAGSLLRRHCFRVLGEYFTYVVQVRQDQPVVERGAYRWIRHPSYTGGILMFAGMGLAQGNWISFAVMFVTILAVYAYRVRIEERTLVAALGQRYTDYMRRTRRFVPWVV